MEDPLFFIPSTLKTRTNFLEKWSSKEKGKKRGFLYSPGIQTREPSGGYTEDFFL